MEQADPRFDFLDFVRGFTGLSASMDDVEVDLPEIALALPHGLNKTREESRDIEAAPRTIRRAPRYGKVKIRSPGASKESFCECSPSEGLLGGDSGMNAVQGLCGTENRPFVKPVT
jgi:hypothetical protein